MFPVRLLDVLHLSLSLREILHSRPHDALQVALVLSVKVTHHGVEIILELLIFWCM